MADEPSATPRRATRRYYLNLPEDLFDRVNAWRASRQIWTLNDSLVALIRRGLDVPDPVTLREPRRKRRN